MTLSIEDRTEKEKTKKKEREEINQITAHVGKNKQKQKKGVVQNAIFCTVLGVVKSTEMLLAQEEIKYFLTGREGRS